MKLASPALDARISTPVARTHKMLDTPNWFVGLGSSPASIMLRPLQQPHLRMVLPLANATVLGVPQCDCTTEVPSCARRLSYCGSAHLSILPNWRLSSESRCYRKRDLSQHCLGWPTQEHIIHKPEVPIVRALGVTCTYCLGLKGGASPLLRRFFQSQRCVLRNVL